MIEFQSTTKSFSDGWHLASASFVKYVWGLENGGANVRWRIDGAIYETWDEAFIQAVEEQLILEILQE